MKILHIITKSEAGGAQTVLVNLANELSRRGHEVTVVGGEGDGTMFKMLDKEVKSISLPCLQRAISPIKDIKALIGLRKIYCQLNPDIIHLHSSKAGILGRTILPWNKIVYTVHGFDSIRMAFPIFLPLERVMQYMCSAIVGVSAYDYKNLLENKITRNVSYILNGIPEAKYADKLEWDIPKNYKKSVLCIARLSPQKNHLLFFGTAKRLPDVAFVWIGNLQEPPSHPANVFFLGSKLNASRYCQLADILMLPSNYEGLPMVILEGMSYAKPIIASRVGGVDEIVINDYNGYALDNDPVLFAEAIRSVLDNDDIYKKMSDNSLKYFKDKLTQEKMVDQYLEIYNKIFKYNNK